MPNSETPRVIFYDFAAISELDAAQGGLARSIRALKTLSELPGTTPAEMRTAVADVSAAIELVEVRGGFLSDGD